MGAVQQPLTSGQQQMAALEAALADKEKQLAQLQAEMNALRREHAQLPVADYALTDGAGQTVMLSAAFGEHKRLLLIHNMGFACSHCTLWAEGFKGLWEHIESGQYAPAAKFLLVSNDPHDVQARGAAARGWGYTTLSVRGTSLFADLGFAQEKDGKWHWWPGVSALEKRSDGSIQRVGMDTFGPGDAYCSLWPFKDLFPQPPA